MLYDKPEIYTNILHTHNININKRLFTDIYKKNVQTNFALIVVCAVCMRERERDKHALDFLSSSKSTITCKLLNASFF